MPVEIKELIIRAVVSDSSATSDRAPSPPDDEGGREAMIEECVQQVLRILRRKEER